MIRLEKLKASSVRGLPRNWPELEIHEGGIIIYGPNGVGKSSVVDALEYALTGDTTLFAESRAGLRWDTAAPHVRFGTPEITFTLKHRGASSVVNPADPQTSASLTEEVLDWLEHAKGTSFILRRHMLLHFIYCQPRDRYDQLEPFLELDVYRDIEMQLKAWTEALKTQISQKQTEQRSIIEQLRTVFALATDIDVNDEVLYQTLNTKLTSIGLPTCSQSEVDSRFKQIEQEMGDDKVTERLRQIAVLQDKVKNLCTPSVLEPLCAPVNQALEVYEEEKAKVAGPLIAAWLEQGKEIVDAHQMDHCPLCETNINRTEILKRLEERVLADKKVVEAGRSAAQKIAALKNTLSTYSQSYESALHQWQDVFQETMPAPYPDFAASIKEFVALLETPEIALEQFVQQSERLALSIDAHDALLSTLDEQYKNAGGGERRLALSSCSAMLKALLEKMPVFVNAHTEIDNTNNELTVVETIYNHAVEARKEAVQEIITTVSSIANVMYSQVHPEESLDTSELQVRQAVSQSIDLSMKFDGKPESPMLHLSESHLDTLGLCYFLAIRKLEALKKPSFKFLVLDDVLHSVDAEHRSRIVALLKDEFADHQLFITTHDSVFYSLLNPVFRDHSVKFERFNRWDIETGPLRGDPRTDLDKILPPERDTLAPEDLAGAAGRFFESLLRIACENLNVKVPARFTQPLTINDLWPNLAKKLKEHRGFKAQHEQMLADLEANLWIRNKCGAHYNEPESPVTPAEVVAFAAKLEALYRACYCSGCSRYIAKDQNEDFRCRCGGLNYPRNPAQGAGNAQAGAAAN